ncbi:MAG TPA: hypothetical protein VJ725_12620 [Thermoanaerobaculia bacterium]|nr:hypothetical protein [Thermoanaerobaculia bacterium]
MHADRGFYRSPELKIVLAGAAAAVALVFAVLAVLARRTDLLLVDLRPWEPVASSPFAGSVRSAEEVRAYFDAQQTPVFEQRPMRLTLRLPPSTTQDFLAASRAVPVAGNGSYCLRVFVIPLAAGPDARLLVSVDGAVAASLPATEDRKARIVEVAGIRPRDGQVDLRFELRAGPGGVPEGWAPAADFDYATLRECDRE